MRITRTLKTSTKERLVVVSSKRKKNSREYKPLVLLPAKSTDRCIPSERNRWGCPDSTKSSAADGTRRAPKWPEKRSRVESPWREFGVSAVQGVRDNEDTADDRERVLRNGRRADATHCNDSRTVVVQLNWVANQSERPHDYPKRNAFCQSGPVKPQQLLESAPPRGCVLARLPNCGRVIQSNHVIPWAGVSEFRFRVIDRRRGRGQGNPQVARPFRIFAVDWDQSKRCVLETGEPRRINDLL